MSKPIRLSPSGPVIGVGGPGMVLKTKQASGTEGAPITLDGTNHATADQVANSEPELTQMGASSYFIVEAEWDCLTTSTDVSATVVTELEVSPDNGATWIVVDSRQHQTSITDAVAGADYQMVRPMRAESNMTACSSITGFAGKLRARALAYSAEAADAELSAVDSYAIRITEYFNG